ncbi:MAG: HAMP domain-containing sensor histidine kinase [Planctomycetota bacterium]
MLLVLVATFGLGAVMSWQRARTETERFTRVATTTGLFIEHSSLPTSQELARDLERVTGHRTFFRARGELDPGPGQFALLPLIAIAANRVAVPLDGYEAIAVPIVDKGDLVMVREVHSPLLEPLILQVLAAFLLLAMITAWLVVRGLVRPLRHLKNQLPQIEQAGPLDLPEARRHDEIGDLARAFVRTRQALQDERAARERVEKLAVLGRMTAALAHEVQNPIAAIRMHAQLWRGAAADGTAATIEHEASRIENLLNQWMFLTRPEPPAVADLDVGALLARVVAMHRAQADHAAVRIDLAAGHELVVAADGRRLDQVFRNLLTNALQAMPGGGTLSITATRGPEHLRVVFADSGHGFSAAALERFAEYFFSEKEGGMGIGLSVANEIVKAHGGRLAVANRDGGGALVTVELPAIAAAPASGIAVLP